MVAEVAHQSDWETWWLQATVQRIELDLRWDSIEFLAALDPSTQRLQELPSTIEVRTLSLLTCLLCESCTLGW